MQEQINMKRECKLQELFQELLDAGCVSHRKSNGYEVIDVDGYEVLIGGNKYVSINFISRHKTLKHMLEVQIKSKKKDYSVQITTDHICMIYTRDHFFSNIDAHDLRIGDYVSVYSEQDDVEYVGEIVNIEDKGTTDQYVYDIEVDDPSHAFYANDILIHNSQFIDIQCVTDYLIKKYGLPEKIKDWPQEKRQELWDIMQKFTDDEVNKYVRDAVHEKFKTEMQRRLTYELEYMVDVGLYESMKHYFVHKIFEEGDAVDKVKVTGISLKKNETDKAMKGFLEEIYRGVVIDGWTEAQYQNYIYELYQKFTKFNVDEVAFWKGYGTARDSIGFLQMAKGATQISRACTYYNQIIEKLGLGKKYEQLRVGDKCRFTYILPSNRYGIECIAYKPGAWPKEFSSIFQVDYSTMFNKIILDQLKRFREACHFEDSDPRKQVVQDLFEL